MPLDLLRKMKESAFGPAEVHKGPMGTPERTSGTHKGSRESTLGHWASIRGPRVIHKWSMRIHKRPVEMHAAKRGPQRANIVDQKVPRVRRRGQLGTTEGGNGDPQELIRSQWGPIMYQWIPTRRQWGPICGKWVLTMG